MKLTEIVGKTIVLATMHGKERAFGPVFGDRFEIEIMVPTGLDTDSLGTFTGEVPRMGSIEETATAKARLGASVTGQKLVLASEGAYGPHPTVPFIGAGFELAILLDTRSGRIIREHLIDENPVFDHVEIGRDTNIDAFLARVRFPDHAVVVRGSDPLDGCVKGIRDRDQLDDVIGQMSREADSGPLLLQTDMRAHLNPRRMETLGRLARKLADRLACPCPACDAAGFGLTQTPKGLPCMACGFPTDVVAIEVWGCTACGYNTNRWRRDGRVQAEPGDCPRCNP
ncbi:DUF6671 family protein [Loktanella sp. DJP18]|uniref:DUF6671 family protein n=1 Tax=Loktanella sp. DJP18 TaxID=3409788 RepID=UPI003BB514F1